MPPGLPQICLLAVALIGCAYVPPPPALTGPVVAYTARTWRDPTSGGPMKAVIFFPPMKPLYQQLARLGPWWVEATSSQEIAFGKHPVIFISHGHEGSRFGHHDLAVALARAGFIVCAIEHPGDNYADQTGAGTERVWLGRAWQISAAIDSLSADPLFAPHLDQTRIGVAGFSAGGYTSLLLVGAKPDFTGWAGYCGRHPDDKVLCRRTPPTLSVGDKPTRDPRVRAAFVMAPVGIFFGPQSLLSVNQPVSLAVAEKDTVLLPSENADVVRAGLSSVFEFTQVPGAGHYVFLAPCDGEAKLCADPPDVNRRAVHASLNTGAVKFFQTQLR